VVGVLALAPGHVVREAHLPLDVVEEWPERPPPEVCVGAEVQVDFVAQLPRAPDNLANDAGGQGGHHG
jgi:hypothetical protein